MRLGRIEHAEAEAVAGVAAVAERDDGLATVGVELAIEEVVEHDRVRAARRHVGGHVRQRHARRRVRIVGVVERRVRHRARHVAHALHVQAALQRQSDAVAILEQHVLEVRRHLELVGVVGALGAQLADVAATGGLVLGGAEPAERVAPHHLQRVAHRWPGLAADVGRDVEPVGVQRRHRHRRVAAHRDPHGRIPTEGLGHRLAGGVGHHRLVGGELAGVERDRRGEIVVVVDRAVADQREERLGLPGAQRDDPDVAANCALGQARRLVRQRQQERAIGPRALGPERHRRPQWGEPGRRDVLGARDRDVTGRNGGVVLRGDRCAIEVLSALGDGHGTPHGQRPGRPVPARDGGGIPVVAARSADDGNDDNSSPQHVGGSVHGTARNASGFGPGGGSRHGVPRSRQNLVKNSPTQRRSVPSMERVEGR